MKPRLLVLLALCLSACRALDAGPPPLEAPLRVLLLGDSISIGYTPHVRAALDERALVVRPTNANGSPENCAGTNHGVQHVARWLALEGGGFDVIHFNFGLHDLKRVQPGTGKNSNDPEHPHQAPPERYAAQLRSIVTALEATGARLIFATTTPVPAGGVKPHRDPRDVERYNDIARALMAERGIQVNDLYSYALARLDELQQPVNVHFTRAGSRALADRVVAAIEEASGWTPRETGELPVGDSFLRYEALGSGPALVFLHGGQADMRIWDPQVAAFAADHRVVRYDIRGYGRSGAIAEPFASHADLHALVETLDLRDVTLVGLSLGGRVAIDYALEHPERVARLVLVGPGVTGWDWSGEEHAFFDEISAAAEAGDTERAVELWLACPYMAPAMENPDLAPRLSALAHGNRRAWSHPAVEVRRAPPATEQLARLTLPTLLVLGTRDVPDIQRIGALLARELPDLRRVDLEGAGHLPNLEAPARFDAALRAFLDETSR